VNNIFSLCPPPKSIAIYIFAVNREKKDIKDKVIQAISDLTLIVNNADTMTLAQARQAIKKIAVLQRAIIKRLVQIA